MNEKRQKKTPNPEKLPMPDDEIIRLDPNDFENILNDNIEPQQNVKKHTDRKKKNASLENHDMESDENNNQNVIIKNEEEEILQQNPRQKPKKAIKSQSQNEQKDSDEEMKHIFGMMNKFIRKAMLKSISRTLKELEEYIDQQPENA